MKLENIDYNGEIVEYTMGEEELKKFISTHLPEEDLKNINLDEVKDLYFSIDRQPEPISKFSHFMQFGVLFLILTLLGLGIWKIIEFIT